MVCCVVEDDFITTLDSSMRDAGENCKETCMRVRTLPHPKKSVRVGRWNLCTMYSTGKSAQVCRKVTRYKVEILGISECRWKRKRGRPRELWRRTVERERAELKLSSWATAAAWPKTGTSGGNSFLALSPTWGKGTKHFRPKRVHHYPQLLGQNVPILAFVDYTGEYFPTPYIVTCFSSQMKLSNIKIEPCFNIVIIPLPLITLAVQQN